MTHGTTPALANESRRRREVGAANPKDVKRPEPDEFLGTILGT